MRDKLPGGTLGRLLAAWLLLNTSIWAFTVAVAVHAYGEGGAGAVGAVTAARLLPALLVAPLAGHMIDRTDRARVVAAFTALQAIALAGTAAVVLLAAPLPVIVGLVAIVGALAAAPRPALQAQMPALAQTPEDLIHATAAWSAFDNAGFLIGSGIGGIGVAVLDPGPVLVLAAAFCALAAVVAARLPANQATAMDEADLDADDAGTEERVLERFASGFRALRDVPSLRIPFALLAGVLVLEGASDVQLVALALDNLDMGEGGPGALYTAWGVGGLFGGALAVVLLHRRGYGLALGIGAILFGAGFALAGAGGVALALAALVPAGLAFALVETAAMGLVPRCADDAIVGRVYGLSELTYAAAGGFGALLAPLLIDWLGARGSIAAIGGAYALMAVLAWPSLIRLDAGQEEATRVRMLLRGVPFMAPLPLPRLERLVQCSRAVSVSAGRTIVAKGDPGEDFFVIEAGTVEVLEFGRTQSTGDGFGEIALLRDIPRTATVRATTDCRLRALARPAFLAAITQHSDAASISESVVRERLSQR